MFQLSAMGDFARVSGSSEGGALAEKVYAAERGIALLRLLVVASGWITYPLLDKARTVPWLAYLLLGLAGVYALWAYLLEPYRKYPLLLLSFSTSISDALLTMVWLYATGGAHSPYFLAILPAVIAVGVRFTPRETFAAAGVFAVAYLVLVLLLDQLAGHEIVVLIRILYILMAGVAGGIISRHVLEQLIAKSELEKRLETEKRLAGSEAALAEAQAIAHVGSWNWEFATGQHTWSSELCRIMGHEPGCAASHESFLGSITPEERPALQLAMAQARADHQPFHGEYRLLRPSGEVRQVYLKGQVVVDELGQPVRMSGTLQDVTETRALERRLMVADRMAALGTIAGGIAHEINNPLTFITTNLAYLDEALGTRAARQLPHTEELRRAVSDAREGAGRVRNIVRELKSFSRVEEARHRPIDVHRGLEFSINIAAQEIRQRARLVRDYGQVPPVLADETRLGQVFLNLLVNAAQAIPEGSPEANTITVRTRAEEPRQVVVEVSDTGAGMAPEVLARIFDPFFTTKPAGVGTGLGLSICHSIVSSFGGRISARSEVGKGTTFTVTLPATEAPLAESEAATASPTPVRGHVLLIDDEPMVAASLGRALKADHDISTCTGTEALKRLLAGEQFDVLVCDLSMPDISGMDLFARLQEQRPAMAERMIFLTGGAFTEKAQEFIAQARYWLEKPVDLPVLRTLLQEVLRTARGEGAGGATPR
jgi:PAS domain S-box-containing protein